MGDKTVSVDYDGTIFQSLIGQEKPFLSADWLLQTSLKSAGYIVTVHGTVAV